jgi:hypothetical protein
MVDEFNSGRRLEDEDTFLRRMLEYLDDQGELDPGDRRLIREWLQNQARGLQSDWSRIVEDLKRQGEQSLANDIESRIQPRIAEAVDALVMSHLPDSEWAILIGAGGSKPAPTEIPTVQELLPRLWEKAEEINAPSLLNLKARCEELRITNIEDLLTAIDLAQNAASSPRIASLVGDLLFPGAASRAVGPRRAVAPPVRAIGPEVVENLSESSQLLFSVLVGMMKDKRENPIHQAISSKVARKRDVIITTNYDVCIERALGADSYDYGLDPLQPQPDKTLILKLHGSLSWYVCKSCDGYVSASLDQLEAASRAKLYPVVAMCGTCDSTAQQLIVPPVGAKSAQHPALLEIRQKTEDAFSAAPVLLIVGYSFSESDL